MPWAREDYWSVLAAHLIDRSIALNTMVVLHWGSGSDEIDGGLLDAPGPMLPLHWQPRDATRSNHEGHGVE